MDSVAFIILLTLLIPTFVVFCFPFPSLDSAIHRPPYRRPTLYGENVSTIYYQGKGSTQTQASKYLGRRGFVSPTTGEKVDRPGGIDIIMNLFIGKEIEEVELYDHRYYYSPISYIKFAAGGIKQWFNGINITSGERKSNKTLSYYSVQNHLVSIGGPSDRKEHKEKYEIWKRDHPGERVVLFGVSRGAATTFSAMADYNYENVALVVLEGCPVHLERVIRFSYTHYIGGFAYKFVKWWYPNVNPEKNGQPWDKINQFPQDVPVAIIASKGDQLIPYDLLEEFAIKLSNSRKGPVYFLSLENAGHSSYPLEKKDSVLYYNFMHALYGKLGLCHYDVNVESDFIDNFEIKK